VDAIRFAAGKNNPPDLINVALEMLVKASFGAARLADARQDDLRDPVRGQHGDVRADRFRISCPIACGWKPYWRSSAPRARAHSIV
jgi:hypothetical protein